MSSNTKTFTKYYLRMAATAAIFVFAYVILIAENKEYSRKIIECQEILDQKKNIIDELQVEYQKYSSEEWIVKYAKENLNMVRNSENIFQIQVNQDQLSKLNNLINKKYE